MARKLIDLSVSIREGIESDPPSSAPRIAYTRHDDSVRNVASFFPGLTRQDLPDGQGWAVERLDVSSHNGTHMDAPWHYHSYQDAALPGGPRPSLTIDEVPLEWCWGRGVKLDFRHLPDGHVVSETDVEAELARIGHDLQPLDILVVNTAAGALYGKPGYLDAGCGMGREATLWLTSRGVRVVGTDAWSWDAPFSFTAGRWERDHDPSIIWEGHKAGRDIGYCQMEKLHGLDQLPSTGFEILCFPVKIHKASAGWCRVVAVLDD
ncbi:cyclase family protein [Sphingomonas sp. CLY1604]|uniref:cyclase family protein n=1 Tax=Sphingomonas sp. CLY1604 TaxID=3457786 RepID=UPI003FD796B1